MNTSASELRRSISLTQGIALYVGAVVGAGVLILPGVTASIAGPASVLSWAFVALVGIPLALTFAALAARFPDAGGVATFTARAFGPGAGTLIGWFYFIGAATGMVIVPLSGAYYAAGGFGLGRGATFLIAGLILALGTLSNVRGLQLSGRAQLLLSGSVALLLLAALLSGLPGMRAANFTPFLPHGWSAVGQATLAAFFAVFGWEAVAQLSAEFNDPARDVVRSTTFSVGIIALLYVGVAAVTVGTGMYGNPELDRVAVAGLLGRSLGLGAGRIAAALAVVISLATVNAFVAGTSRLGYALARDGGFPAWFAGLDLRGVPVRSVLVVGAYGAAGLILTYLMGGDAEDLLVVPNSLGVATYVAGTAAGLRLLAGRARVLSGISLLLCLGVMPFSGATLALPIGIAAVALLYRRWAGGPDWVLRSSK